MASIEEQWVISLKEITDASQDVYEDGVVFRTEVTTTDASLEVKAKCQIVGISIRVHEDTTQ